MNPIAWWHARSQAERFDISFRSSFYVSLLAVPMLIGLSVGVDLGDRAALVASMLALADMVLIVLLMHHGIEYYLGRRDRPTVLLLAAGAVTALGCAAGLAAFPITDPDSPAGLILTALTCTYMVGIAGLRSMWPALAVAVAGAGASTALSVAQGAPSPLGPAAALLFLLLVLFGTYRSSLWMLHLVWELDRARTVQAGLAVAEERLRFARDMHDVLGRNLSVIALKAELAAQLAKRGREQAVDEMLDVRRIAQDALADVRAVVAGYRSADLGDELAGARSLLASAGIEGRVIGDPADLPPEVQGTLGWVVREGVTNVLRHSDARTCTITLRSDTPGTVTLTMDNDGARTPTPIRYGGGLLGLTERVATLSGTLTATTAAPSRFLLTASIPLATSGATSGSESSPGAASGAVSGATSGSETSPGAASGAASGATSGSETSPGAASGAASGSETSPGAASGAASGSESGPGAACGSGTRSALGAASGPGSGPGAGPSPVAASGTGTA